MRDRVIAFLVAMGFCAAASAAELQPKTIAFLTELGFNPKSSAITDIAGDMADGKNLDTLASVRDETMVRRFVATRNFVRNYKKDTRTPFPPADLYHPKFLTPDEVKFVSAETLRQRCAAEKASGAKPSPFMQPCPN